MALQHLRSSTANKRPTPAGMSDGQLALNTNDGSPGLFFKDSNSALVKVGPVHVGTTAPNATPGTGGSSGNAVGEQWLDTSGANPVLKIWNGSQWVDASPQGGGGTSGKILQVVTGTYNTQTNFTTTTMTDVGLSASITPSSTSSTVLAIVNLSGLKVGNPNNSINFQLLRGSTVIAGGGQYNNFWANGTTNAVSEITTPTKLITYRDSPSSTSSLTYKVQACARSASTTVTLNLNDGGNAAAGSTLILMEVAA